MNPAALWVEHLPAFLCQAECEAIRLALGTRWRSEGAFAQQQFYPRTERLTGKWWPARHPGPLRGGLRSLEERLAREGLLPEGVAVLDARLYRDPGVPLEDDRWSYGRSGLLLLSIDFSGTVQVGSPESEPLAEHRLGPADLLVFRGGGEVRWRCTTRSTGRTRAGLTLALFG